MHIYVTIRLRVVMAVIVLVTLVSFGPTLAIADLLDAAKNGDVETATKSLEVEGIDPTSLKRPLFFAAQRGHAPVVAVLLENGADPNTAFTFGAPLHAAARANFVDVLALLLKYGADPNLAAGDFDQSALHEAADRGALDAAQLLLEHGADVNFRNDRGRPPIHNAMAAGRIEMADFLRENGAAPNLPEPFTETELANADVEAGRIAMLGCNSCHKISDEQPATGPHVGPSLVGIFGREKASRDDYKYSDALQDLGGTWTAQALNDFIADPTGVAPGTEMLRAPEMTRTQRIGLIAFLRDAAN